MRDHQDSGCSWVGNRLQDVSEADLFASHRDRDWCRQAAPVAAALVAIRESDFTAEQLLPAVIVACGEPSDRRSFGSVIRRLARDGRIVRAGFAAAATSHNSPKPLWRSA